MDTKRKFEVLENELGMYELVEKSTGLKLTFIKEDLYELYLELMSWEVGTRHEFEPEVTH